MNRTGIKYLILIGLLISLLISSHIKNGYGQQHITMELLSGGTIMVPSRLFIYQEGHPEINISAHYSTNPFHLPIYYSLRLGYMLNPKASISLELNHLKIYLDNKIPEIDQFSITHGYNQLWFNYKQNLAYFNILAGFGPVIAHPENTIRGLYFDQNKGILNKGYYLAGISSQVALQKTIKISKFFFFTLETKFNIACSKINVVNGFAYVPIIGIHGQIGLGTIF